MPCQAIIGSLFGDEAKGKLCDLLAGKAQIVERYNGAHNAGHTIVVNGVTYKLHLLPSGVLYPGVVNVIGNGVAVNVEFLLSEIRALRTQGIDLQPDRLRISPQAHVILPFHVALDKYRDAAQGIGTTGRGVGPAYEAKMGRRGVRIGDLLNKALLASKIGAHFEEMRLHYSNINTPQLRQVTAAYLDLGSALSGYIDDTVTYVNKALRSGQTVIAEGAQGTYLDVDHGTYPFVTSSNPTIGGVCTGMGIAPRWITETIGVVKAYSSRVGGGPFPTEDHTELGHRLWEVGKEDGTSTGRKRRCGWVDLVLLRHSAMVNGFDWMFLTKLDVLSAFDEIPICDSYRLHDGSVVQDLSQVTDLADVRPIFHSMPGWRTDITSARLLADLPSEAREYVSYMEERIGVPANMISVGPGREQTIYR